MKTIMAIAALALAATPVHAIERSDQPIAETIDYADLDLSTDAGIGELDRRIAAAVNQVCNREARGQSHGQYFRKKCRKQAHAQLGQKRQSLIDAAHAGKVAPMVDMTLRMAARSE